MEDSRMSRHLRAAAFIAACAASPPVLATESSGTREFKVASGGKLTLDLDTGGGVKITGTGGSSVSVSYKLSCSTDCQVSFDQSGSDVRVETKFERSGRNQTA